MLEEPHPLGRAAGGDPVGPRLHLRQSFGVGDEARRDDPFDRRRAGDSEQRLGRRKTRIGHAPIFIAA